MVTFEPVEPPMPFRILRPADYPKACAVYYRTREARDAGAQRWADQLGAEILTELWEVDGVHDDLNRGWGCDGAVRPVRRATVKLRIENHYELYSTVVTEPTVTIPLPPARDAYASEEEHAKAVSEWEYDHIYDHTGTGRTKGDSWYFVEIVESDVPELLGREFEF